MGNIISLQDGLYQYEIPLKEPSDEKDIINFDKKRGDDYWHTPIIKNVKLLNQKDRIDYIERERQRWVEGCFVKIDGDLVYLTGMMYDHLTYMTFKGAKAEFFRHQVEDFYFRDLTRRDPKCRGRVFMKPRRYGMTMEEITESTYSLLENFSNNVGLQSDTKEKVKDTLLLPIIQSYVKRPKFMRSDYYKPNGKLLVSEIKLSSNLAPGEDEEEKGDYILGWLKGFPTLPRSMDGNEMVYIVMDEAFKYQASPKEILESNIKVLMGRGRAGLVSMLSTMGDSDDYVNAVMEACDIISRSNPKIRDDNGQTLSGLYEYFVSAIYSFDIPPDVFEVDKFGQVNKDKHLQYIQNKINKLDKNSKSYVFEKRRLPLSKSDAMLSSQTSTNFRRIVINDRLSQLRGMPNDEKPYVRGNLVEDSKGKVWFESDAERQLAAGDVQIDNGIWLWRVLPYFSAEKNIDTRNRFRVVKGIHFPPSNPEGSIGYDPINSHKNQTTSTHLSRAAIVVKRKFNYYQPKDDPYYFESGIIGLCLFRPDDPHDANKEAIKAAKFTGYPVMHERSVSHPYEDFNDSGMLPFLLKDEAGVYGMSPSDLKAKRDGLAMLQARYSMPKDPTQTDELEQYPFEEGLMDLDNFDIGNTTPFDVTMAEIYAEHGLKQVHFTNVTEATINNSLKWKAELIPKRR